MNNLLTRETATIANPGDGNTSTETYSSPNSLSGAAIAILIVVLLIFIAKIVLITYCCMRCLRHRKKQKAIKMNNMHADTSYSNGHAIADAAAAEHGRPVYYGEAPVYRPQDARGPYKPVGNVNEPAPVYNRDGASETPANGYGSGR